MPNSLKRLGPEWANTSLSHGTLLGRTVMGNCWHNLRSGNVSRVQELPLSDLIHDYDNETDDEIRSLIYQEDFFDLMASLAPEGCYFGAHPGDGSDFGFWKEEDTDA